MKFMLIFQHQTGRQDNLFIGHALHEFHDFGLELDRDAMMH